MNKTIPCKNRPLILKNAVEHIKTPFALSQSKGERGFDMLTKWVGVWKPLMVRQAHHERFPHASTDFFRLMLIRRQPNTQQGFSYLELMIVVVILGVIGSMAIPNLSFTDTGKLDNAAKEVAKAIQFARIEAIRSKIPHGIKIDAGNDRIQVYSLPASTPVYDKYHPIDKKPYDIQLKTAPFVAGVELVSAGFSFAGSNSSTTDVQFNTYGNPKYTNSGSDYMLISGTITLAYGGEQRIVSISPMTGRVTIQ